LQFLNNFFSKLFPDPILTANGDGKPAVLICNSDTTISSSRPPSPSLNPAHLALQKTIGFSRTRNLDRPNTTPSFKPYFLLSYSPHPTPYPTTMRFPDLFPGHRSNSLTIKIRDSLISQLIWRLSTTSDYTIDHFYLL